MNTPVATQGWASDSWTHHAHAQFALLTARQRSGGRFCFVPQLQIVDHRLHGDINFFRNRKLTVDPYPFFDELPGTCPVVREPHQGAYMVTGYDEAVSVYRDHATFSSCNTVSGPFVKFSVPVEGDDISDIIDAHRD